MHLMIKNIMWKWLGINDNIEKINKSITTTILNLVSLSSKIKYLAMNQNHIEIENEYIQAQIDKLEQIGDKDNSQLKKLKEFKKYNEIYQALKDISEDELINKGPEIFLSQLNINW